MKIEIGESLMLSYLKHVKKCTFYQTNWKVSSNWDISPETSDKVQFYYNEIIKTPEFSDIFKKSGLDQLLKQAEIDIMGLDSNNIVYAIDIAFHENGLQYGDKNETKDRVFKKLLRSYLTLLAYFPNKKYEILFVSPKVNNAAEEIIKDYFDVLDNLFSNENTIFYYISNELFSKEILFPTIEATKSDSDTNELFIRAVNLLKLFDLIVDKTNLGDNIIKPKRNGIDVSHCDGKYNADPNDPILQPDIVLQPDRETFKRNLIRTHRANWIITYSNGKEERGVWNANNFTESSDVINNIRSGYLRNWRKRGIIKAIFEV